MNDYRSRFNVADIAFAQGKNLIITHGPGSGVVGATLNSILDVTRKTVVADASRLDTWDLRIFDAEAEILVFDQFQRASKPVKASIRELVAKKVAEGVNLMPNLNTVVVLMTVDSDEDHLISDSAAVAQELGRLAPSIVINVT